MKQLHTVQKPFKIVTSWSLILVLMVSFVPVSAAQTDTTDTLRILQRGEAALQRLLDLIQTPAVTGPTERFVPEGGLEEALVQVAVDVVDGSATVIGNLAQDTHPGSLHRGDVGSSVIGVANRVLRREDDSQVAFVALYNDSGIQQRFEFDLSRPIESLQRFAALKGIPLSELRVAMDVNPAEINKGWIVNRLTTIGVERNNIVAFPQIQQAMNVALNHDRRLAERSPFISQGFDIMLTVVGATEVAGWANAVAPIEGTQAKVAFFPKEQGEAATDFETFWGHRFREEPDVQGHPRTIFDLEHLVDTSDHRKAYAATMITGYMEVPGVEYDDEGVTTYTLLFEEGQDPVVQVDRFVYTQNRDSAFEAAVAVTPNFKTEYSNIYHQAEHHGPEPRHETAPVVDLSQPHPHVMRSPFGWREGFLGLKLESTRRFDLQGQPTDWGSFRASADRDVQAAAIASGWFRGIAKQPVDVGRAKMAIDRIARDAMAASMRQHHTAKWMAAFEAARDGSAALDMRQILSNQVPHSPVVRHEYVAAEFPGWSRVVHVLRDGTRWPGGIIADDVNPSLIHNQSFISEGSMVHGEHTRVEADAQIIMSEVRNSIIGEGAQLVHAVADEAIVDARTLAVHSVLEPAFEDDDWAYSAATESDPNLSVGNHTANRHEHDFSVEVGADTTVHGTVVHSSFVGAHSSMEQSAVMMSSLGEETSGSHVKFNLAVMASGHADVAGVQHFGDGVTGDAAVEVAETAIVGLPDTDAPGVQFTQHNVGYTEVVVMPRIPIASYTGDGDELRAEFVTVPPAVVMGDYLSHSIFAGAPNPTSIKTDGASTPGVITKLTGGPEQSSAHGRIVSDPFSVVTGYSNVIGRLLEQPDLDNPLEILTEQEVTHLAALSVDGVDEVMGLNGLQAWGQFLPGEAKGLLSRARGIAPWAYVYAPELIFHLMGQVSMSQDEEDRDRFDAIPNKILESGLAMAKWLRDQEQAKEAAADQRVVDRLTRYIRGYEAVLATGAFRGAWVQDGNLRRPEHWKHEDGQWHTERMSFDIIHPIVHPRHEQQAYEQVAMAQLLPASESPGRPDWRNWNRYYLTGAELNRVTPRIPAQAQLQPVSATRIYQERRIVGRTEDYYYTLEGGRIDVRIPLANIDPTAVIGPGTVLNGESTRVGANTRLTQVTANEASFGENVTLRGVAIHRSDVEDNVRLTWANVGPHVRVGQGTEGLYVALAEGAQIGPNNTLYPYALIANSTTSAGNIIGGWLIDSKAQTGYMGIHLSTAIQGLDQRPVTFQIAGTAYDLGAAAINVTGGMQMGDPDAASDRQADHPPKQVIASVAYALSLSTVRPGVELGAFTVSKNELTPEGEILPFTFHAYDNVSPEAGNFAQPGRHNDRIGGALDFPGMFLRNLLYRVKKGIQDDLKAQGVSNEADRLQNERLLQSDYMVEATIVQALSQVLEQLGQADDAAESALRGAVEALQAFVEEDLRDIEQADQTALGARSLGQRLELHRLIQAVQNEIVALGDRASTTLSDSGHTATQLVQGVGRLAQNLDGRWRMRNHTFTEVEWRYVDYGPKGRPVDAWVPVPLPAEQLLDREIHGVPVRTLLQRVPTEFDTVLDQPFRVAWWVSDVDDTTMLPGHNMTDDLADQIRDSQRQHNAWWTFFSGSSVGESTGSGQATSTDLQPRLIDRLIASFDRVASTLRRFRLLGGVGQQVIVFDAEGAETRTGVSDRFFTDEQQLDILRVMLATFVERVPDLASRENWASQVSQAADVARLEGIAAELQAVLGWSRLELIRRGISPAGQPDPNYAGTMVLTMPVGENHTAISEAVAAAVRQVPGLPTQARLYTGPKHMTISLFEKVSETGVEYDRVAAELEDGAIVMLADNPDADDFFEVPADRLGNRPILRFLVDEARRRDQDGALLSAPEEGVPGTQQIITQLLDAQTNGVEVGDVPIFHRDGQSFSIRDLERATGHSWADLRAAGLEEEVFAESYSRADFLEWFGRKSPRNGKMIYFVRTDTRAGVRAHVGGQTIDWYKSGTHTSIDDAIDEVLNSSGASHVRIYKKYRSQNRTDFEYHVYPDQGPEIWSARPRSLNPNNFEQVPNEGLILGLGNSASMELVLTTDGGFTSDHFYIHVGEFQVPPGSELVYSLNGQRQFRLVPPSVKWADGRIHLKPISGRPLFVTSDPRVVADTRNTILGSTRAERGGLEEEVELAAPIVPEPEAIALPVGLLPATASVDILPVTLSVGTDSVLEATTTTLPIAQVSVNPSLIIEDAFTGMTTTIPASGLLVDGYSLPGGGIVPDTLIDAGLVEPGATRLLVPPAVLNGSQQLYIQAGLLDASIIEALRVQGVAVTEFLVSDIPEPEADVPSTFIAAVAHGSEAEARMARVGTVVNLYGSSPELRPTTLSSLATLIQVAVDRDGLLRVNAIFVDDVSGAIAIDLYA